MVTVVATQIPNAVNTTRYIRLLCHGLHQAGIAMKATAYALLSPSYEWMAWMSNRDDPFSVVLSLAVTTFQNDGKILLWAWFQRFPQELQLHDITAENLRKAFDNILKRLDELAGERGQHSLDGSSDELPAQLTPEEATLFNTGVSYLVPVSESVSVVRAFVDGTLKQCIQRIETALNPRATDGAREWPEAFVVNSQLRLCTNLILKAIT
ncbi:hypothetical protein OESDEN_17781, partial [Oesophagostomum dentatum]